MKQRAGRWHNKSLYIFLLFGLITFLSNTCIAGSVNWEELGGKGSAFQAGFPTNTLTSDYEGNIFAAGWFRNQNGKNYVAKWEKATNTWKEIGGDIKGADFPIHAITSDLEGNIYAGGELLSAPYEYYVAKWDKATNTWSELGGDRSLRAKGWVQTVEADANGNIYAAGGFYNNSSKNYVARWDKATNTWSELGGENSLQAVGTILDLCIDKQGNIYISGSFRNASGNRYVARWDKASNTWSELGGKNSLKANQSILKIAIDSDGNLFAGGDFTNIQGKTYVSKWDKAANTWTELGGNNSLKGDGTITSVITFAGNVYAAGYFINSAGSKYVAKWDPATGQWSELGGDNSLKANKFILALTADPTGEIYAAGGFRNAEYICYVAHLGKPLAITGITPTTGCNGAPFTISGRGFDETIKVTVGGVTVNSFTIRSAEILEIFPTQNSYGIVEVTTPLGTVSINGYSVIAPLSPEISIEASITKICAGKSIRFTAIPVNGGSSPTYRWFVNGVDAENNSGVFTSVTLANGDKVSCMLMSSAACLTQPEVTSNIISVEVQPLKNQSITITASAIAVCEGEPITFQAYTQDAAPSVVYQWRKNGLDIGVNTESFTATNFKQSDTLFCTMIGTGNCLAQPTATSNIITLTVNPKPKPVLEKKDYLCKEASRTLDPGTFSTYKWSNNSTERFLMVTTLGKYAVTVTDVNGCTNSDSVLIESWITPLQNFLPNDTSICSFESITLRTNASYRHYLWSDGSTGNSLNAVHPGRYWLKVTDANNCTAIDTITIKAKECNKGIYIPTAFTPNGDGKNDLFRPVIFGEVIKYQFIIYNRWGEKVFESTDPDKAWSGNYKGATTKTSTFIWTCTYQMQGQEVKQEKGTVTIIR